MSKASPAMQNLALRLMSIETKLASPLSPETELTQRVCEKLRVPLQKFAGPIGYSALFARALSLASINMPELKQVKLGVNGKLEGWSSLNKNSGQSTEELAGNAAGIELIAQLISLLVTFIGEPLTLTLLRDGWPGESFDNAKQRSEL